MWATSCMLALRCLPGAHEGVWSPFWANVGATLAARIAAVMRVTRIVGTFWMLGVSWWRLPVRWIPDLAFSFGSPDSGGPRALLLNQAALRIRGTGIESTDQKATLRNHPEELPTRRRSKPC